MAIERPVVLDFEGLTEQEARKKARDEFRNRYGAPGILDALGNEVLIHNSVCHHICYKDDSSRGTRDVWRPDRAAHIPWIFAALTNPWEIRPNKVKGRLSYFLQYPCDLPGGHPREATFFAVTELTGEPKKVALVTAFPNPDRRYWNEARQVGACLYPPEKADKAKAKKASKS